MIFTRNLLNKYLNLANINNEQIVNALTSLGFEVASVKNLASGNNLISGKILSTSSHPSADKLVICLVDIGKSTIQIVCGAKNVAKGQKVIVALPGCQLPIGLKIEKSIIRDQESNGMICSLKEIGFPENLINKENKEGIFVINQDVTIGDTNILKTLNFEDTIFELEITPNRPDGWSVYSIAKELAIYFNLQVKPLKTLEVDFIKKPEMILTKKCSFFTITKIDNICDIKTPSEIQLFLQLAGFNPQNILVDISNFVLLELGQPSHFFTSENNDIKVKENEKGNFVDLNDKTQTIKDQNLVIKNKTEIISLAGVIGGKSSATSQKTTTAYLEVAIFDKLIIRKTMNDLNLFSKAGNNFTKGRNKPIALLAIKRIKYLLSKYLPNVKIETTFIEDKILDKQKIINFNFTKINYLLGTNLTKQEMMNILEKVGCEFVDNQVIMPNDRLDLVSEVDLAEEVARIYGYDNIKEQMNYSTVSQTEDDLLYKLISQIKKTLVSFGSFETKTYALTSEQLALNFALKKLVPLKLKTFISNKRKVMRQSVIPSLIEVCQYNIDRKIDGVNIFEISRNYHQDGEEIELGLLHFGHLIKQKLYNKSTTACFYTIKGYLEKLLDVLGVPKRIFQIKPIKENPFYNHFAATKIEVNKKILGYFGEVNHLYLEKWKNTEIYVLQLDIKQLSKIIHLKNEFQPISKFPIVFQDFTFLVNFNVSYLDIKKAFGKIKVKFKYHFELVDVFDDLKNKQKAITIKFTFINEQQTFIDEQINDVRTQIIKLAKNFNGEIKD